MNEGSPTAAREANQYSGTRWNREERSSRRCLPLMTTAVTVAKAAEAARNARVCS